MVTLSPRSLDLTPPPRERPKTSGNLDSRSDLVLTPWGPYDPTSFNKYFLLFFKSTFFVLVLWYTGDLLFVTGTKNLKVKVQVREGLDRQ